MSDFVSWITAIFGMPLAMIGTFQVTLGRVLVFALVASLAVKRFLWESDAVQFRLWHYRNRD